LPTAADLRVALKLVLRTLKPGETLEGGPLIVDVESKVLPPGYELLPGLNSIYELELALSEARALSKDELVQRGAYFARIDSRETNHYRLCSAPLQVGNNSFRLRAFFEVFRYKTSYATHGLFPYRGKFHPQLIKAIMNVIGLKRGDIVLDPMTGSATTNVEASLIGIDSIGFDMNPFAVFMGKTKIDALSMTASRLGKLRSEAASAFEKLKLQGKQKQIIEPMRPSDHSLGAVHPLLLLCYFDALGYSKRVKSKTLDELFPIVRDRYISALKNFISVRDELGLNLGSAKVEQVDARNLGEQVESSSIDGIITSPPYSFAIDYLKGDSIQLEYLGHDRQILRESMLGLRGSGLKNQVFNYLTDMDMVLAEMARVLKPSRYSVIITGTNTVQLEKINETTGLRLEEELLQRSEKHGFTLVQRFERPIEGIQNVMKSEHILFLKKQA
jgi:DNA modification methylase